MTISGIAKPALIGIACGAFATAAVAAPQTYVIDSNHTYPTFEADHMGGVSFWRGKINSSSGTVTMDKEARTGSVDVTIDMSTIDFGHDGLNTHAKSADMFDVAQFPNATFTGRLTNFVDGAPTAVEGNLTMHGQTHPVTLDIDRFKCIDHPMMHREVCGADAMAKIDRSQWGVNFGQNMGFNMDVTLRISIEAIVPAS